MAVKKQKPKAAKKKPVAKRPTPKFAKTSAKRSPAKSAKPAARRSTAPRAAKSATASSKGAAGGTPAKKEWLHPPVVHWEIAAVDSDRQRAFFSDLFGWSIDANNPQNYGMVPSGGEGAIGGGIGPAMDGKPYVAFYVEVPDIDAALAKAAALGASTIMPRTDVGMVILAQFRDPEGNLVGLIEASPS
jgi:predicted enzyme related to lactoylglutathione lyase